MKVYAHIGYYRTGTTFLQTSVLANCDEINPISKYSHYDFIMRLAYQPIEFYNFEAERTILNRILDENKINVISDENLIGNPNILSLNMSSLKKIRILIPNIKIIFILRNQIDLIKSLYLQYVKSGGIKKISHYFITSKNNLADIKVIHNNSSIQEYSLNYYNIIKYLKGEFGILNIEILIYEEIKNNLKEEFCNAIGLESKHEIVKNRKKLVNRSLSNFEYKMLIFFNNFFRSNFNNTRLALIKQKHLFNLINRIDNKLNLFDNYEIPKELEKEWSKIYTKSNNQIVSEFNILLPKNYID